MVVGRGEQHLRSAWKLNYKVLPEIHPSPFSPPHFFGACTQPRAPPGHSNDQGLTTKTAPPLPKTNPKTQTGNGCTLLLKRTAPRRGPRSPTTTRAPAKQRGTATGRCSVGQWPVALLWLLVQQWHRQQQLNYRCHCHCRYRCLYHDPGHRNRHFGHFWQLPGQPWRWHQRHHRNGFKITYHGCTSQKPVRATCFFRV